MEIKPDCPERKMAGSQGIRVPAGLPTGAWLSVLAGLAFRNRPD
jgi:hypothetical protein